MLRSIELQLDAFVPPPALAVAMAVVVVVVGGEGGGGPIGVHWLLSVHFLLLKRRTFDVLHAPFLVCQIFLHPNLNNLNPDRNP